MLRVINYANYKIMQSGYAKIALVKLAATQHIIVEKSVKRFFKVFHTFLPISFERLKDSDLPPP